MGAFNEILEVNRWVALPLICCSSADEDCGRHMTVMGRQGKTYSYFRPPAEYLLINAFRLYRPDKGVQGTTFSQPARLISVLISQCRVSSFTSPAMPLHTPLAQVR